MCTKFAYLQEGCSVLFSSATPPLIHIHIVLNPFLEVCTIRYTGVQLLMKLLEIDYSGVGLHQQRTL